MIGNTWDLILSSEYKKEYFHGCAEIVAISVQKGKRGNLWMWLGNCLNLDRWNASKYVPMVAASMVPVTPNGVQQFFISACIAVLQHVLATPSHQHLEGTRKFT